mmetsp:Transcript_97879/g.238090  ORF Transcript_97879/g.238090 Transcript_97879/m.238090 type:complete len:265 (+) Transcript_97879:237-1031(+)
MRLGQLQDLPGRAVVQLLLPQLILQLPDQRLELLDGLLQLTVLLLRVQELLVPLAGVLHCILHRLCLLLLKVLVLLTRAAQLILEDRVVAPQLPRLPLTLPLLAPHLLQLSLQHALLPLLAPRCIRRGSQAAPHLVLALLSLGLEGGLHAAHHSVLLLPLLLCPLQLPHLGLHLRVRQVCSMKVVPGPHEVPVHPVVLLLLLIDLPGCLGMLLLLLQQLTLGVCKLSPQVILVRKLRTQILLNFLQLLIFELHSAFQSLQTLAG